MSELPPCLRAISDTRDAFRRYSGRSPASIKVGLRCMSLIADEFQRFYHVYPDLTLSEHRALFLQLARRGEVKVFGMTVRVENQG